MRYAVEDGILVVTLLEAAAADQFIAGLRTIMADPAVPAGLPLLLDVRGASSAPSATEVRRVSLFFRENEFFGRVSALAVANALQFGVGRMGSAYEAFHDRVLNVFRDEAEARAFLRAASS